LHYLATEIGGMTVEELEKRMSYREYENWLDYFSVRNDEQLKMQRQAELDAKCAAESEKRSYSGRNK